MFTVTILPIAQKYGIDVPESDGKINSYFIKESTSKVVRCEVFGLVSMRTCAHTRMWNGREKMDLVFKVFHCSDKGEMLIQFSFA